MKHNLAHRYEDLEVYKKAFALSLDVHRVSLSFPKIEQYALANQLRKSSKSICANIAEGYAKQKTSRAEFLRFLMIALGSANETKVWLTYCKSLGYISPEISQEWITQYDLIARMINRLHEHFFSSSRSIANNKKDNPSSQ